MNIIYIYIYIGREREREKAQAADRSGSAFQNSGEKANRGPRQAGVRGADKKYTM